MEDISLKDYLNFLTYKYKTLDLWVFKDMVYIVLTGQL